LPKVVLSLLVVFFVAVFITVIIPILEGQYKGTIAGKRNPRKYHRR
jgi:hypothetical protein